MWGRCSVRKLRSGAASAVGSGSPLEAKETLRKTERPLQTPHPTAGNDEGKRPEPRAEERPRGERGSAVRLHGETARLQAVVTGTTGPLRAHRDGGGARIPGGADPAARRKEPRRSPEPRPLLHSSSTRSYRKQPQHARVCRVWRQRLQRQLPATRRTEEEVGASGSDAMMWRKPLARSLVGGRERPLAAWRRRGGRGGECTEWEGGMEELWERWRETAYGGSGGGHGGLWGLMGTYGGLCDL